MTEKLSKRNCFFAVMSILWMSCIFLFSARDAELSIHDSNTVGRAIGKVIHSDYEQWTEAKKDAYADKIELPVRKCAHAAEYALLALLLMGTLWKLVRNPYLFAWGGAVFYAMTDEFHQRFVDGRSGNWIDVGIDGAGALLGILTAMIVSLIIKKILKK